MAGVNTDVLILLVVMNVVVTEAIYCILISMTAQTMVWQCNGVAGVSLFCENH